jgi:hypothetical protein
MSLSLLEISIYIVKIAESTITKEWDVKRRYCRLLGVVTTFETMWIGMNFFLSPVLKFFCYWSFGLLGIAGAGALFTISPPDLIAYRFSAAVLSFSFVAFALPSSYVSDKITDAHIREVVSLVRIHVPLNAVELKALESTISEFYARSIARVNAFQWIMAASWALATYVYSQFTGVAMKILSASDGAQEVINGGMHLAFFAFLSLLMLWAIFGYKRSIDRTFRLSLLSLRQLELELPINKQPEIRQKTAKINFSQLYNTLAKN